MDSLQLEAEYLLNAKKLGRLIKIYANDKASMPQVAGLAKTIMDKWSRMVFGISTTYIDRGGDYEDDIPRRDQYKRLKKKLEAMHHDANDDDPEGGSDNEGETPGKTKKQKQKALAGLMSEK